MCRYSVRPSCVSLAHIHNDMSTVQVIKDELCRKARGHHEGGVDGQAE